MKATMKAWAQTKLGGVEVLKVLVVPKPTPSTVRHNTARRWVQITLWIVVKAFLNKFKLWASRYHLLLLSLLPHPFYMCVQGVNYVYNTVDASSNFENVQKAVLPFGAIASITATKNSIDVGKLFVSLPLSVSLLFSLPLLFLSYSFILFSLIL